MEPRGMIWLGVGQHLEQRPSLGGRGESHEVGEETAGKGAEGHLGG